MAAPQVGGDEAVEPRQAFDGFDYRVAALFVVHRVGPFRLVDRTLENLHAKAPLIRPEGLIRRPSDPSAERVAGFQARSSAVARRL